MVYYSHVATWDDHGSATTRARHTSSATDTFMAVYIASNLVAAIGQLQTESGLLLWQLMFCLLYTSPSPRD